MVLTHPFYNPTRVIEGHAFDETLIEILQGRRWALVTSQGLPGCWSQGATEAEAIGNIRDAIAEYRAAVAQTLVGEDVRETEVAD